MTVSTHVRQRLECGCRSGLNGMRQAGAGTWNGRRVPGRSTAVSPPSPRLRSAPTGSGTPGTHPAPGPRQFPPGAGRGDPLPRARW